MPTSRIISKIAATAIIALTGAATFTASTAQAAEIKSRADWKKEYVRPAEVPFPEDNPYTAAKAELGRTLFFDPRLSGSNYISCGTCHNPSFAWGDGLPKGIGHAMTVLGRRTPTVLNLAWSEQLMWDGRFETLEDQALGPMSAPVEMNQQMEAIATELQAIPEYKTLFKVSFGGEGISVPNIAKAIATFERTIVSGIAPFDRWVAGEEVAISESAKRGFDLFNNKANCVACHSGWNFTDDSFHDVGLPDTDIGRGKQLPDIEVMQHAFKVPTLRNSVERAPYMHDGSLRNLFSVVAHYNDGTMTVSKSARACRRKSTS
jgi:cytochrome c peroxidase